MYEDLLCYVHPLSASVSPVSGQLSSFASTRRSVQSFSHPPAEAVGSPGTELEFAL